MESINTTKKIYTDEDRNFIIQNYYLKTSSAMANIIGSSRSFVLKVWMDNKLNGKDKARQYYCDFDYFSIIDKPNKAYLVGLLSADGCLFKREGHQGQVQLSLHEDDLCLLNKINEELHYNKEIEPCSGDKNRTISINSDVMYGDLVKIGLYDNKTATLDSKNIKIPIKYIRDYIRGYFDGDGSIYISKPKSNINITPTCYNINISGFIHNLISISNYLKGFNINSRIQRDKREYKGGEFGSLIIRANRDKYFFVKTIYQDIKDDLYMERKYKKSCDFINLIENNIDTIPRYNKIVKEYNCIFRR